MMKTGGGGREVGSTNKNQIKFIKKNNKPKKTQLNNNSSKKLRAGFLWGLAGKAVACVNVDWGKTLKLNSWTREKRKRKKYRKGKKNQHHSSNPVEDAKSGQSTQTHIYKHTTKSLSYPRLELSSTLAKAIFHLASQCAQNPDPQYCEENVSFLLGFFYFIFVIFTCL